MWPYNTETDTGNFWVMYRNKLDGPKNWLYNVWYEDYIWNLTNTFNNKALNQGAINMYFSRMSQAMAFSCAGTVYVMTDDPHNLPTSGIWGLIEYPSLQYQYDASVVEKCIAITYKNPDIENGVEIPLTGWSATGPPPTLEDMPMMDFDWISQLGNHVASPLERRTWEEEMEGDFRSRMRDLHERRSLTERDACLGGQVYELPGHDYFGEGR
ncbi:hypothetical protein F5884DRAFT_307721 [Xylogone sp. PMI_703]|nr:hypothetical protein F5884DRAFT_307721 [Xylogone sp. PMI_703]